MFPPEASTVREIASGTALLYHCEVTGMPRPTIRWRATDVRNNQEVPVSNNTVGIQILMITEDRATNEAISELTLETNSNFESPICEGRNGAGVTILQPDEFVEISSMSKQGGKYAFVHNL